MKFKIASLITVLGFLAKIPLAANFFYYPSYYPAECFFETPPEKNYKPGTVSFTVTGSVAPTWYLTRTKNTFIEQTLLGGLCNIYKKRIWEFEDQYRLPWCVGAELAYLTCNRIEFFAQGEYVTASRKTVRQQTACFHHLRAKFNTYESGAGYLGIRIYSCSFWCNRFAGFLGGKIGLLYRAPIKGHFCFKEFVPSTGQKISSHRNAISFKQGWVASGGFQCGLNYHVCYGWAFQLKVEALLSGCWETRGFKPCFPAPEVILGQTGPILSIPVTFGIRRSF